MPNMTVIPLKEQSSTTDHQHSHIDFQMLSNLLQPILTLNFHPDLLHTVLKFLDSNPAAVYWLLGLSTTGVLQPTYKLTAIWGCTWQPTLMATIVLSLRTETNLVIFTKFKSTTTCRTFYTYITADCGTSSYGTIADIFYSRWAHGFMDSDFQFSAFWVIVFVNLQIFFLWEFRFYADDWGMIVPFFWPIGGYYVWRPFTEEFWHLFWGNLGFQQVFLTAVLNEIIESPVFHLPWVNAHGFVPTSKYVIKSTCY